MDRAQQESIQDMVLALVREERRLQDIKWGSQRPLSAERWMLILMEEVGETAEAIMEEGPPEVMNELVQVAAVAVCALESLWAQAQELTEGN